MELKTLVWVLLLVLLGYAIARLGDFNGDGYDDFAMGAPGPAGTPGAQSFVLVAFGGRSQNSTDFTNCNGQNCFIINGVSIGDGFGSCLAGGEDVSGDKIPDLLVGAPYSGSTKAGQFFGIFGGPGPWPAQFNLSQLTGPNGFASLAGPGGTFLGCPIVMGNLQNNPIAGFAVAAPFGGALTNGILYVFNGRNATTANGTWPAMLNFNLDGTTEGFVANGRVDDEVLEV